MGIIILAGGILIAGCGKKQPRVFSTLKDPATVRATETIRSCKGNAGQCRDERGWHPDLLRFLPRRKPATGWPSATPSRDLRKHAGQYEGSSKVGRAVARSALGGGQGNLGRVLLLRRRRRKIFRRLCQRHQSPPFRRAAFILAARIRGGFWSPALEKSQADGDPFFTLTQNALADGTYLDYLRSDVWRENLHAHRPRFAEMF